METKFSESSLTGSATFLCLLFSGKAQSTVSSSYLPAAKRKFQVDVGLSIDFFSFLFIFSSLSIGFKVLRLGPEP